MKYTIFTLAMVAAFVSGRPHQNDLLNAEVPSDAFRRMKSTREKRRAESKKRGNAPTACKEEHNAEERFMDWAMEHNRSYRSKNEMNQRRQRWQQSDDYINEVNARAAASEDPDALTLKHNMFSDMDEDERRNHFGRQDNSSKGLRGGRKLEDEAVEETMSGRRFLQAQEQSINWVTMGKVTPVKDQGNCGSCYAFAGNTALESAIAIAENSTPVHISE